MNVASILVVALLMAAIAVVLVRLRKKHKTKDGHCAECDATGCIFRNRTPDKKNEDI